MMAALDEAKQAEFRRLLLRVRQTASDFGKQPPRSSFREIVKGLYAWTAKFVTENFPELKAEFDLLPSEPGTGHPLTFEGQLMALRTFLDTVEDTLTFESKGKVAEEFLILPGQAFTAKKRAEEILRESKKFVKIVDNYLSADSVEIIETINNQRDVFILTKAQGKKFQNFINAVKRLKKGWKGKVEVRSTNALHDRYLIIDDQTVWHCGPSLDYLGISKPGVISKLEDDEVIKTIVGVFDKEWKSGTKVL